MGARSHLRGGLSDIPQPDLLLEGTRFGLAGAGCVCLFYGVDNLIQRAERPGAIDRAFFALSAALFALVEWMMTFGYGGELSTRLNAILYSAGALTTLFYSRALADCLPDRRWLRSGIQGLAVGAAGLSLLSLLVLLLGGAAPMTMPEPIQGNSIHHAMTGGFGVEPTPLFTGVILLGFTAQVLLLGGMWAGWGRRRYTDRWILVGVSLSSVCLTLELGMILFAPGSLLLLLFVANLPEVVRTTVLDRNRARDEIARAHRDLKESQDRLVQAEKMSALGLMASSVAHELNNPVAAITLGAELLAMDLGAGKELPRSAREGLDVVKQGADMTRAIAKQLLTFGRQSGGELREIDLRRAVEAALGIASLGLKGRSTEVSLDLPEQSLLISGDPNRIGQFVLNLVINASDAMERSGEVVIKAQRDGDRVRLEVSDTGPGIPADLRDKLFEPFFTTKPAAEGTGLGLSVARQIMEDHGGSIDLEADAGPGATFVLEFPGDAAEA